MGKCPTVNTVLAHAFAHVIIALRTMTARAIRPDTVQETPSRRRLRERARADVAKQTMNSTILRARWFLSAVAIGSLLLISHSRLHGNPLGSWQWRNPLPQGDILRGVAYGNGTFVAVGKRGAVLTSQDGAAWSFVASLPNDLNDISFANGLFVAVGGDWSFCCTASPLSGEIYTSVDGTNWTKRASVPIWPFKGIAHGNGIFVAVSGFGVTSISSDGVSWTNNSPIFANAVAFANGIFVAVGDSGTNGPISTSTDGINWTTSTSAATEALYDVAFGGGTFVAVGADGTLLTSPTGETWTVRASGTPVHLRSVAFQDGTFVAAGDGGTILTSLPGTEWTTRSSGETMDLLGVGGGNGRFVVVGRSGMISTSADGAAWTRSVTAVTVNELNAVAYGNGSFAAVGQGGTIVQSVTGSGWTARASGTTNDLRGITFANGTFIAVGDAGTILTSSDAINWQPRVSGSMETLNGIAYGNETFVVVGASPSGTIGTTVHTSPTGDTWTSRHIPSFYGGSLSVAFGNGIFVATGWRGSYFMRSTNGVDWSSGILIQPVAFYSITFGADRFLAAGDSSYGNSYSVLWGSSDGFDYGGGSGGGGLYQAGEELYGITYGNSTFVAVGKFGTVLAFADEQHCFYTDAGTDALLRGVAFGNGTFVAVGSGGAILQASPSTRLTIPVGSPAQLTLWGLLGQTCRIESTDTLGPGAIWQSLTTLTLLTNPTSWTNPSPLGASRFYRAVVLP